MVVLCVGVVQVFLSPYIGTGMKSRNRQRTAEIRVCKAKYKTIIVKSFNGFKCPSVKV